MRSSPAGRPGRSTSSTRAPGPLTARTGSASTHGLGLAEALELGRALGRLPARTVVVGIEAGQTDTGDGLSAPVLGALDAAAAQVLAQLGAGHA